MDNYETVSYSVSNQIATIALNRPAQLNALNRQLASDLCQALNNAENDDNVRVIIVTGTDKALSKS